MRTLVGRMALCFSLTMGAFASTPQAHAADPLVMKLASATVNDAQHDWMKQFAAVLEKEGKGQIKVELYPASQLGSSQRMIEGVQFGAIQGYICPADFLTNLDSRFQMVGAPGLFKDLVHANRTLQSPPVWSVFSEFGSNKGIEVVGAFPTGAHVFAYTSKISTLGDLAGKKTRIAPSPLQMEQIKALGATPVPMTLGEVLPALQQGAIDGAMTTLDVLVPLRFYDTAKYIVDTEHAVLSSVVILNRKWVAALSPELRQLVLAAARSTTNAAAKLNENVDMQRKAAWQQAGGTVVQLSDADTRQLLGKVRGVAAEVAARKPEDKRFYDMMLQASKASESP